MKINIALHNTAYSGNEDRQRNNAIQNDDRPYCYRKAVVFYHQKNSQGTQEEPYSAQYAKNCNDYCTDHSKITFFLRRLCREEQDLL